MFFVYHVYHIKYFCVALYITEKKCVSLMYAFVYHQRFTENWKKNPIFSLKKFAVVMLTIYFASPAAANAALF